MLEEAVEEGGAGVAEEEEEDGVGTTEMTWKFCSNLTRDELSASSLPPESKLQGRCFIGVHYCNALKWIKAHNSRNAYTEKGC
jgi:hypothetical protein